MMKGYKNIMFRHAVTALSLLAVAACVDTNIEDELDDRPIILTAQPAFDATRAATTDVQGPLFDAGEKVNVYIEGSTDGGSTWTAAICDVNGSTMSNPIKYQTSLSTGNYNNLTPVTASDQPYYPLTPDGSKSSSVKARIHAAYPANSDVNVTPAMTTFTVQYDQTTVQAYKNSDLMMAEPFVHDKSAAVVTLPFKHKMTKLIVNAIADGNVEVDNIITIGYLRRSVAIDVNKGDFAYTVEEPTKVPITDEYEDTPAQRKIRMLNGGAVLFPPQYVEGASEFIMITGKDENGQPQTAQFNLIGKTFEEGRVYKLNLHISNTDFTPNPNNGEPHVSTITGWSEQYDELTVTPSGGYSGVNIADIDGHVTAQTSSSGAVTDDGYYMYSYDANRNPVPCCPRPSVTYGDENIPMIEGVDFRYEYVDNVNSGTNAQVMVIGMGAYSGLAALKPFTIRRATGRITFPDGSDKTGDNAVDFNPDENIGFVKALNTGDGVVTYSIEAADNTETTTCASINSTDGDITLLNVGKCTVRATVASGRNFDYPLPDNTCTYKLEIAAKVVNQDNLTITYAPHSFTYDGTQKTLTSLVVADGEHTLTEGVDYTYTLTDKAGRYSGLPIHHGTALLTITGKGNYNSTIKIDIPIKQATPTLTVETTELALAKYNAAAPKDRRKTREATTEDWAQSKIRYSLSKTADVKSNTILSVTNGGRLTGVYPFTTNDQTEAPQKATVYVRVDADDSQYQDWTASEWQQFDVTVYKADFVFKIKRYSVGDYREKQVYIQSNGIPEGAHTKWICPAKGEWQIDCYGAQGGSTPKWTTERTNTYRKDAAAGYPAVISTQYQNQGMGGRGAHIAGRIMLTKGKKLHVNLGQKGRVVYPGEIRLRGPEDEVKKVKEGDTGSADYYRDNNRGYNSGRRIAGDVGYLKAGDYEWAAFAWNGGGGLVWGAHGMWHYPWYYLQDNDWVGDMARCELGKTPFGIQDPQTVYKGGNISSFPNTSGGGATDVSLAWDETLNGVDGKYYPPSTDYSDADRSLNYLEHHSMANREYGVGCNNDNNDGSDADHPVGTQWKNPAHLFSRIIVAGGGGGGLFYDSSNAYGDGGDGGAWEGTRGLFYDYGLGGFMNCGGLGGILANWKVSNLYTGLYKGRNYERTSEYDNYGRGSEVGPAYHTDIVYRDGPYAGGYSCTDGMFGEGGNTFCPVQGLGGGGGGWYGGGAGGQVDGNGPGGGGSSFMWTDQDEAYCFISASATHMAGNGDRYGLNHTQTLSSTKKKLFLFYDSIDDDYLEFNGVTPEKAHKKAANFLVFMPVNSQSAAEGKKRKHGIECPFFHQIVTKDAGANAGDGWAKITLVEIDDIQSDTSSAPMMIRRYK